MKDECFFELIKDSYGNPCVLADFLDKGIEMLFYLEEDTFQQKEIQGVVSAIRSVIDVLRQEE